MASLPTNTLIKIIIGVVVFVIVVGGIAFYFGGNVFNFFRGITPSGNYSVSVGPSGTAPIIPPECSDCGFWCRRGECNELGGERVKLGFSGCEFDSKLFGFGVCKEFA